MLNFHRYEAEEKVLLLLIGKSIMHPTTYGVQILLSEIKTKFFNTLILSEIVMFKKKTKKKQY